MSPKTSIHGAFRGFSIVEVIVVMAIIGILVLVLVPVVGNRAQQARIRAAEQDLENLASALERAGVDTGYMYPLTVLDNVAGGDGIVNTPTGSRNPNERIDGMQDEQFNPIFGQAIFIDIQTQAYSTNFLTLYQQLIRNETAFGWRGPYINWHVDSDENDWPDDPWGNEYLLFTSVGAVSSLETGLIPGQNTITIPAGPGATRVLQGRTDLFDRPAVLSLGPNGEPGDGSGAQPGSGDYGQGDDLLRKF